VLQRELLARVVSALEELHAPYMVTGAIASSIQGAPRLTHDIDIVVVLEESDLEHLAGLFPTDEFYLDRGSAVCAVKDGSSFNLIDTHEGSKVDFWMLTDEPFDRSRFARRRVEEVLGMRLVVSSPEDTILQKLNWAKLAGGSEKQFMDALRVYEVQSGKLDIGYLEHWAGELEVEPLLQRLKQEAPPT